MSVSLRLLLTLLTLACPLNCMGAFEFSNAPEEAAPACACCHHHSAEEESSTPEQQPTPFDDCSCASCFCQGALLSDDELELADSHQVQFVAPPPTNAPEAIAPTFLHRPACPEAARPTGAMLRILHQTFLL